MGWGCPCCSQRLYDGGRGRYCASCGYICYTGENYFERLERLKQDQEQARVIVKDETGSVITSGIEASDNGHAETDLRDRSSKGSN